MVPVLKGVSIFFYQPAILSISYRALYMLGNKRKTSIYTRFPVLNSKQTELTDREGIDSKKKQPTRFVLTVTSDFFCSPAERFHDSSDRTQFEAEWVFAPIEVVASDFVVRNIFPTAEMKQEASEL